MKKVFKILSVIAGLLIVGFLTLGPAIAEWLVFRDPTFDQILLDNAKTQYDKWRSVRFKIPVAALEVTSYSAQIKKLAQNLDEAWASHKDDAFKIIEHHENPRFAPNAPGLPTIEPLLQAFSALVRHPDYEICACASAQQDIYSLPEANFLQLQTCAKLLRLKALAEVTSGRLSNALRDVEILSMATRVGWDDTYVTQLTSMAVCSIGIQTWNEIVRSCDDPILLQQALAAQNALAGRLDFFDPAVPGEAFDKLGKLREYKRRGLAVACPGEMTGQELDVTTRLTAADYYEHVLRPLFRENPSDLERIQFSAAISRKTAVMVGGRGLINYYATIFERPTCFLYYQVMGDTTIAPAQARVVLSRLDLLRIETASRLYKIKEGKTPERTEDLVPDYLPQLPCDRCTKNKASYHKCGDTAYSTGPDGQDNQAAIFYDPSNGTLSMGDLFLNEK